MRMSGHWCLDAFFVVDAIRWEGWERKAAKRSGLSSRIRFGSPIANAILCNKLFQRL